MEAARFDSLRREAHLRLLRMHYETGTCHVGGNLSCLDALLVLYHQALTPDDRFILSKGHSAGAWYVALWSAGLLDEADLDTFCRDNTLLPGHPSGRGLPGLVFPTGSLGHGPALAAGLAMALRHKGESGRVFCLCSDGEWQEGSCWESLAFAARFALGNLRLMIDLNGLQAFGSTEEVMGGPDLARRMELLGARVAVLDGHDPAAVAEALAQPGDERPAALVLRSRKGRGLYFENELRSHYCSLTRAQYEDGVRNYSLPRDTSRDR